MKCTATKAVDEKGPDLGYFPETDDSLFIFETPGQEDAPKRKFEIKGLTLIVVSGSRYLGAYLGPRDQLEAWVKPQVEAWAHGIRVFGKISQQHP